MIIQIKMTNCQSWEDGSFTLATDRLNVIAAENDTGKSVFIKMLKITACPKYYSRDEWESLIRWGAEYAQIIFLFADGDAAATRVYRKKVLYLYRNAGESAWESSYEPSEKMLANAGLVADVKNKFVANIIDTDQDLLLVNEKLKSNYDLMRLLIFCDDLEAVREKVEEERKYAAEREKSVSSKLSAIEGQISLCKYTDIRMEEAELDRYRECEKTVYELIDIAELLEQLDSSIFGYKDYQKLFSAADLLEQLELLHGFSVTVMEEPSVRMGDVLVLERLESIHRLAEGARMADSPQDIEPALHVLESLEEASVLSGSVYLSEAPAAEERFLEALEALESLDFAFVYAGAETETDERHVILLEELEAVSASMAELHSSVRSMREAEDSIAALERSFEASGQRYDCPIFGKVVYDGKACIPYH